MEPPAMDDKRISALTIGVMTAVREHFLAAPQVAIANFEALQALAFAASAIIASARFSAGGEQALEAATAWFETAMVESIAELSLDREKINAIFGVAE